VLRGRDLYLFDAPLHYHCPALLQRLPVPRYFPVDFKLQLGPSYERGLGDSCSAAFHHPSIFVGAATSQTGLHRDGKGVRFWLAVLEGTKTVRMTDPHDSLLLKERRPTECDKKVMELELRANRTHKYHLHNELCQGYGFNLFSGDADGGGPVTDGPLVVWEANVSAGEVVFIPEYWAHQVRNLDSTLAISYNFYDDHSVGAYAQLQHGLLDLYLLLRKQLQELLENAAATDADAGEQVSDWKSRFRDFDIGLQETMIRLQQLGYAREAERFPSFTLRDLPSNALDSSWETFFANNCMRREIPLPPEEFEPLLQAWMAGGGASRLLRDLKAERESVAARLRKPKSQ